jgi:hypothetical protein
MTERRLTMPTTMMATPPPCTSFLGSASRHFIGTTAILADQGAQHHQRETAGLSALVVLITS